VTVVDMTDLSAADRTNHLIFAESPEAVRVLSSIFMSGSADPSSGVNIGARLGGAVVVLAQGVTTVVTDPAALAPQPASPALPVEPMAPALIPPE
jgi:esterase/lipase superfamily enzyme